MRRPPSFRDPYNSEGKLLPPREQARAMRRAMTPAERSLWTALRGRALGVKWRRQHLLKGFIFDFYSPEARLVIEVDGPVHDTQQREDALRDLALGDLGLRVVRVRNHEVLHDLDAVLRRLRDLLPPH